MSEKNNFETLLSKAINFYFQKESKEEEIPQKEITSTNTTTEKN